MESRGAERLAKKWYKKWWGITILVLAGFWAIGAIAGASDKNPSGQQEGKVIKATDITFPPVTAAPVTAPPVTAPPVTAPPVTTPRVTTPPTTRAPAETAGQSNARRSANEYLSMGNGFSRTGLIGQLSSSFGEGFSVADATYGVDATRTDWNAQACLSAKGYLEMSAFSHAGLVDQLSSSSGEQFTMAQAEYGVSCAGL